MATTYTQNTGLQKPATADRYWDVSLNANSDLLDSLSAVGQLMVTPTEFPSASLGVKVSAGTYVKGDGTIATFTGNAGFTLAASQTVQIWLTDAGALTSGPAFPTTAHIRLAVAITGASSIQSILDARVVAQSAGSGLGFVLKTGDSMSGTLTVASPTGSPTTFVVNPSTPAIGFFGATPATQAPSVTAIVDNSTGVAGSTLTDAGTSYSQVTLDNNFACLAAKVNALITTMKRHGLMSS